MRVEGRGNPEPTMNEALKQVLSSFGIGSGSDADWYGKVAAVTGGSRGLGYLLARDLAAQGCQVAICARSAEELAGAERDLKQAGATVVAVPCDVSRQDDVQRFVDTVSEKLGPIDILVNNAGIIQVGPLQSMTIADFEEAMGVMYWGVVYPTLAVLPGMRERRRGWIVNITSIGGKVSVPHLLPYSAAKFAAVGFSEGLHAEVARDGISVTTVVPGLMRTGSPFKALFKGDRRDEYAWFTLADSLPFLSIDAERAAREIIQAARQGRAEVILSVPATVATWFHGLFPGQTASILAAVNLLLPSGRNRGRAPGQAIDPEIQSGLFRFLTSFTRSAARRFRE